MKRLLWISVGVGITIYAVRKINAVNEAAARFTPTGIANAATSLSDNLRSFQSSFKESMKEHEARLTQALFDDDAPTDARSSSRRPREASDTFEFDSEGDPEEYF